MTRTLGSQSPTHGWSSTLGSVLPTKRLSGRGVNQCIAPRPIDWPNMTRCPCDHRTQAGGATAYAAGRQARAGLGWARLRLGSARLTRHINAQATQKFRFRGTPGGCPTRRATRRRSGRRARDGSSGCVGPFRCLVGIGCHSYGSARTANARRYTPGCRRFRDQPRHPRC